MKKFKGKVKWYNDSKGFGFLEYSEGTDVFVHYSAIVSEPGVFKTLPEGASVEFELLETDRGPQADRVVLLNEDLRINLASPVIP